MAAASWPSAPTLPQGLLLESVRFSPGDWRLMNDPDFGPPMVRARSPDPDVISGDMIMSDTQFSFFKDTFVAVTIDRGADAFYFPHHETGALVLVMFDRSFWSYVRLSGTKVRVTLNLLYLL